MRSRLYPELRPANEHERFMLEAIKQAEKAIDLAECPIGCVIVKDGKVFVRAHNLRLTKGNSLAHAEIVVSRPELPPEPAPRARTRRVE